MDDSLVPQETATLRGKKRKIKISAEYVNSSDSDLENPSNVEKPLKLKLKIFKFKCDQCSYTTNEKYNLNRHSRVHNPQLLESGGRFKCPEDGCPLRSNTIAKLELHLSIDHGRNMEVETLHLQDQEALKLWLRDLQENHFSKYLNKRGDADRTQTYFCNRSNMFKKSSKSTGKRNPRKLGSIKSDSVCTSRILVEKTDTGLQVQYHKTHTGHVAEPGKLGVAKSPRKRRTHYTAPKKKQEYMDAGRKLAADCFNKALQLATDCESTDSLVNSMKTVLAAMEAYRKEEAELPTPFIYCII